MILGAAHYIAVTDGDHVLALDATHILWKWQPVLARPKYVMDIKVSPLGTWACYGTLNSTVFFTLPDGDILFELPVHSGCITSETHAVSVGREGQLTHIAREGEMLMAPFSHVEGFWHQCDRHGDKVCAWGNPVVVYDLAGQVQWQHNAYAVPYLIGPSTVLLFSDYKGRLYPPSEKDAILTQCSAHTIIGMCSGRRRVILEHLFDNLWTLWDMDGAPRTFTPPAQKRIMGMVHMSPDGGTVTWVDQESRCWRITL